LWSQDIIAEKILHLTTVSKVWILNMGALLLGSHPNP
jgi:hypothetical protein